MVIGHHTHKRFILLLICAFFFTAMHINSASAATPYYWDYQVGISEAKKTAVRQGNHQLNANNGVYLIDNYNEEVDIGVNINAFAPEKIYFNYRIEYLSENQEIVDSVDKSGFIIDKQDYILSYDGPLKALGGVYLDPNTKYTKYTITINDTKDNGSGSTIKGDNILLNEDFIFSYAAYDSSKSPSIEISSVRQGGNEITPTKRNYNDGSSKYVYTLSNDKDYEVSIVGNDLPSGMIYERWNRTTAEAESYSVQQLTNSITINVPAKEDPSLRNNTPGIFYGYIYPKYVLDGIEYTALFEFSSSESPSFQYDLSYSQTGEVIGGNWNDNYQVISHDKYNPDTNPINITIHGQNYQQDRQYPVSLRIQCRKNIIAEKEYNVLGSDLNAGYSIISNDIQIESTISSILNGTFDYGSFDSHYLTFYVRVDDKTETANFGYVTGNGNVMSSLFTTNGLPFSVYSIGRASAGYSYVSQNAFDANSNAYFYFKAEDDANSSYCYYVIYYNAEDTEYSPYMFSNAEIIKQGEATGTIQTGVLVKNTNNYRIPGYAVIIEKDGMIESIASNASILIDMSNYEQSLARIYPYLERDDGRIQYNNSYSTIAAYKVKIFNDGLEKNKEYRISIEEQNYIGNYYVHLETTYSDEITVTSNMLDGDDIVFSLPTDHVVNGMNQRRIKVSVYDNSNLINEKCFILYYADMPSADEFIDAGIDEVAAIREIRSGSFSAYFNEDETFEDEFDVFLSVGEYNNLSNNCGGICGIVGELEYDSQKIELVSVEALEDFEITQGDRIVLNRPTGVVAGTAIMKLHFRAIAMSANTSTTIRFTNIVGSDGINNISTDDASITVRRTVAYYSLTGRLFTPTGEQFSGDVQDYGSDYMIMEFGVDSDTFSNDGYLTAVFDGLGFAASTSYSYSLKSFQKGSDNKETLFSGDITGDTIINGALEFKITNPNNFDEIVYELTVRKADKNIFTSSINILLNDEPHFSQSVKYGYSDSDYIGSHYILPTNSASSVVLRASNIDVSKNYRVSTGSSEYKSCTTLPNGHGVTSICDGPVIDQAISDVTVSGKDLLMGYSISIPIPADTSTLRALSIKIYEEGEDTSIKSINIGQRFIKNSDIIVSASSFVLDNYILSNIPLGAVASNIESGFIINNTYNIEIINDAGSELAQNDRIGTGSRVRVNNKYGQTVLEYVARIKGDLNGDGSITITDLVKAKRHLALIAPVEGIYAEAADITKSGFIGITDIVKICRHIAGLEDIRQ